MDPNLRASFRTLDPNSSVKPSADFLPSSTFPHADGLIPKVIL